MKRIFWLLLILAFVLVACQPSTPVVPNVPAPSPAAATQAVYPPPGSAAALQAPSSGNPAYPEPGDPATALEISWEQAEIEVLNGNVAHAVKLGSGEVVLTLKDSRVLKSVPTAQSDIEQLKDLCGVLCQDMSIRNP